MFFILNHENSIIAADTEFLEDIGANDIFEAALLIKERKVIFDESGKSISYFRKNSTFSKTELSTFLGKATLYKINRVNNEIPEEPQDDTLFNLAMPKEGFLNKIPAEKQSDTNREHTGSQEEISKVLSVKNAPPQLLEENETANEHPETMPLDIHVLGSTERVTEEISIKDSDTFPQETLELVDTSGEIDYRIEKLKTPKEIEKGKEEETFSLLGIDKMPSVENASLQHLEENQTISEHPETMALDTHALEPIKGETEEISIKDNDIFPQETLELVDTSVEIDYRAEKLEAPKEVGKDTDHFIGTEPLLFIDEPEEETLSISDDASSGLMSEIEAFTIEEAKEKSEIFSVDTETMIPKSDISFQEIAKLIGVSEEEYLHFLEDFGKESFQLEANLRSDNLGESREALSVLKEASLLLHLPQVTEKLNALSDAASDEKSSIIDSYLKKVAELSGIEIDKASTQSLVSDDESMDENNTAKETFFSDQKSSNSHESTDKEEVESITEESSVIPMDHTSISLKEIQAIPFDFSINEAADELTLPASLISEFVADFINQAQESLPALQKAYKEKDLNMIQTTAHMLKGASSNLRIIPMSETLYELQFNEDLTRVPELVKLFCGQLKALTLQMNQAWQGV